MKKTFTWLISVVLYCKSEIQGVCGPVWSHFTFHGDRVRNMSQNLSYFLFLLSSQSSLLYHNINLFVKISLEVMQRKCHLQKHSAKMPCLSKQDILHPSAHLSTVLLIILKEITKHHWLTSTINKTPENGGDSVFNLNRHFPKHLFVTMNCEIYLEVITCNNKN